jgi:hypothetical protein
MRLDASTVTAQALAARVAVLVAEPRQAAALGQAVAPSAVLEQAPPVAVSLVAVVLGLVLCP